MKKEIGMKFKSAVPMELVIAQITINESSGSAIARIPGPPPKCVHDQAAALVLHAIFTISPSKKVPGFQYWHHIPSSTSLKPRFVHVSITWEGEEGNQAQLAEIEWPPEDEYRETFTVAIAHMLIYSNQIVQRFYLK